MPGRRPRPGDVLMPVMAILARAARRVRIGSCKHGGIDQVRTGNRHKPPGAARRAEADSQPGTMRRPIPNTTAHTLPGSRLSWGTTFPPWRRP